MMRRLALAAAFLCPVAMLAVEQYWGFLRPHVAGPALRTGRRPAGLAPKREPPTPLSEPGLKNLYRLTKDLYRGAQPTAEGMRSLQALGIRTVVNLRALHSDRDELGETAVDYVHVNVNPFRPKDRDVVEFLRVVTDPNRLPAFVHCQRGIDRTGLMCAVYRIAVCGWSKREAIEEMTAGPFGYDAVFRNVVEYLWQADVDELLRQASREPSRRR